MNPVLRKATVVLYVPVCVEDIGKVLLQYKRRKQNECTVVLRTKLSIYVIYTFIDGINRDL